MLRALHVLEIALLAGLLLTAPVWAADAHKPAIESLEVVSEGDRLLVSYILVDALNDEVLERLHSGIPVAFRYRIEALRQRGWLMPDKELAKVLIEVEASYNSLTRQYSLRRTVEVRAKPKSEAPPPAVSERTTDSQNEMVAWMTAFDAVPVFHPGRPIESENLRVKVDAGLGRRYVWLVFPSTVSVSAEWRQD